MKYREYFLKKFKNQLDFDDEFLNFFFIDKIIIFLFLIKTNGMWYLLDCL